MAVHKNRTNKRHLRAKRHASHARKVSRSRKGGFGDEETNDAGDPKFDRDIEMGVTDADVAESSPESSAESDAELMETGSTMYSPEIKVIKRLVVNQRKVADIPRRERHIKHISEDTDANIPSLTKRSK